MKRWLLPPAFCLAALSCSAWGFYAHRKINEQAVWLLPPDMLVLFKPHIGFLAEHAVDPDKRRYIVPEEGPRHYIDIDRYGAYPFDSLPRKWEDALALYSPDTLQRYGIVPWWVQTMLYRLTDAFRDKDLLRILRYAAETGHYISDAHVPLHACSNHNGQFTGQQGIHGFWESRVPELLAPAQWDFFIGHARYIPRPGDFIWKRILESALAADSVLRLEKELTGRFPPDQKFSFEERNGKLVRQYSSAFTKAYDGILNGMVERRMRQSIAAVAGYWYTAWVNAGQPDLTVLAAQKLSEEDLASFRELNKSWKNAGEKEEDRD